ncbi:ribosome maturation factor RimM [Palleronia caenipelagi]|uniref:Ribosome maturation factor RimM n=1 Tax=Palleronia caenipelagi TaxID=2489174 RepID=A0A547PR74_9RHOB|nr:ribosome maturation factor RimM [Palleronia caenipelagi]TRD16619.1 16S rRNA processing protein RimM [Palleronia caenipelagi]
MKDHVCVGQIAGAYGVNGEVRLKSFCANPADIARYSPLAAEDGREFDLALGNPIKNGFAARLSGLRTKEEADALRGLRLYVPRDRLPEAEEDEFYHVDLIGLEVVDTGGTAIGRVANVVETGGGDLLELKITGVADTILAPFTRAVIPTVDMDARRIVLDPPEGLLPE